MAVQSAIVGRHADENRCVDLAQDLRDFPGESGRCAGHRCRGQQGRQNRVQQTVNMIRAHRGQQTIFSGHAIVGHDRNRLGQKIANRFGPHFWGSCGTAGEQADPFTIRIFGLRSFQEGPARDTLFRDNAGHRIRNLTRAVGHHMGKAGEGVQVPTAPGGNRHAAGSASVRLPEKPAGLQR